MDTKEPRTPECRTCDYYSGEYSSSSRIGQCRLNPEPVTKAMTSWCSHHSKITRPEAAALFELAETLGVIAIKLDEIRKSSINSF